MTSDSSARRGLTRSPWFSGAFGGAGLRGATGAEGRPCLHAGGFSTRSPVWPKVFRISADYRSVRGGMPVMETKNFGQISFEPDSELEFPSGLPGFDSRRRFVAVRFAESDPLVYLQSLEDPDLCLITMPILAVDPLYKLKVSGEDLDQLGLPPARQPRIGADVLCLTV